MAYYPQPPTNTELQAVVEWLYRELNQVSAILNAVALGHLDKTHNAPTRVADGDIRYADGTNWDPGTGEGVYVYYNSTWNKMG